MFLLGILPEVFSTQSNSLLMADWLEDNRADHPEVSGYLRKLRDGTPKSPAFYIDIVAKLGIPKERERIHKLMKIVINHGRGVDPTYKGCKVNKAILRRVTFSPFSVGATALKLQKDMIELLCQLITKPAT